MHGERSNLMLVSFGKEKTISNNQLKTLLDSFRFREIICLLSKHLAQSFGIGQKKSLKVPNQVIANQAFVGHVFDPLGHALEGHFQKI